MKRKQKIMYSNGKICVQNANLAWCLTQGLSLPATIQTISGKITGRKRILRYERAPMIRFDKLISLFIMKKSPIIFLHYA